MTPELEGVELLFRLVSVRSGVPWPPDRWMGARARAAFAAARAEDLLAEAIARTAVIDMYREELREVLERCDTWILIGEELARVADDAEQKSPFPQLVGAMQDHPIDAAPRWRLDEIGRWMREGENYDGE